MLHTLIAGAEREIAGLMASACEWRALAASQSNPRLRELANENADCADARRAAQEARLARLRSH